MSKRWLTDRKRDYYYRKAKQLNYRSRAAFKLIQIDRRFHLFREGDTVIDLGAAPGGWLQVAKMAVGDAGRVVGVDLRSIQPIDGVVTIKGDMRKPETLALLLAEVGGRADVVLSDMAPNISGNYSMDHARSVELVEIALDVAEKTLSPGGRMAAKVFQGDLLEDLLRRFRFRFERVRLHSPQASRPSSSEMYILAFGFRGGSEGTQSFNPENRISV